MNPHLSQAERQNLGGPLKAAKPKRFISPPRPVLVLNRTSVGSRTGRQEGWGPLPGWGWKPSQQPREDVCPRVSVSSVQASCWPVASPAFAALARVSSKVRGLRQETFLHLLPPAWSSRQAPIYTHSPQSSPRAVAVTPVLWVLSSFFLSAVCAGRGASEGGLDMGALVPPGPQRGWWGGWKAPKSLKPSGAIWVPTCM